MKRDTGPDIRYAVGLDIGDGESALCWLSTDMHSTADIVEQDIFERKPKERSVVTATAVERGEADRPNRRVIGDEAVLAEDGVPFSINFKNQPNPLDLNTPESVLFAQVLLTEFFVKHPEVKDGCAVYVGHPTGWDPDVVNAYGQHYTTLRAPVDLMPESQSALVHVRDRRAKQRDSSGLGQVLVVDVGSSTTDVTFVDDLKPRNLLVGSALGCREIDQELAKQAQKELAGDRKFMQAVSNSGGQQMLHLVCRRMKEAQFTGNEEKFQEMFAGCDPRYEPIITRGGPWLRGVEIPRRIAEAPGGWADRFKALLEEVHEQLGETQPELIVLTGGGSRMPVVRDVAVSVFPEAVVENDKDPALTVARGLASAGRHRVNVSRFRKDITDLKDRTAFKDAVHSSLLSAFSQVKATLLKEFRPPAPGYYEAELEQEFDTLIHDRSRMDETLDQLRISIVSALTPLVLTICRSYGIRDDQFAFDFTLPDLVGRSMKDRIRAALQRQNTAHGAAETAAALAGTGVFAARAFLRNSSHPIQFLAGAAAVGLTVGAAKGAGYLARQSLVKALENAELDHDEVARLVSHVAEAIAVQMDGRALEVERYLFQ